MLAGPPSRPLRPGKARQAMRVNPHHIGPASPGFVLPTSSSNTLVAHGLSKRPYRLAHLRPRLSARRRMGKIVGVSPRPLGPCLPGFALIRLRRRDFTRAVPLTLGYSGSQKLDYLGGFQVLHGTRHAETKAPPGSKCQEFSRCSKKKKQSLRLPPIQHPSRSTASLQGGQNHRSLAPLANSCGLRDFRCSCARGPV